MATSFLLATSLQGEVNVLASILADPNDRTAKLVYADWLDERDDPRAVFLRRFVDAVQRGGPLPAESELPDGPFAQWLDLIGYRIVSRLRSLNLGQHESEILRLTRPTLAIETVAGAETEFRADATKFGGVPSLPKGRAWPRCERGPLEFLAQFDLAELKGTVVAHQLPPSGLLSFFMYHNYPQDEYGVGRGRTKINDGLQIIYSPPGADLRPLDVPSDLTRDFGAPQLPHSVTFTEFLDLPSSGGPWSSSLPEDVRENLWELRSGVSRACHQLFGYSHITVLDEDPTPGPDWLQLVGFASDQNLDWGWGDGHRLFWYVQQDDLRNLRFDRTVAIDG